LFLFTGLSGFEGMKMRVYRSVTIGLAAVVSLAVFSVTALGDSITYHGTGGNGGTSLDATAIFSVTGGGHLQLVLTNTESFAAALDPASVLTAIYFNVNPAASLTATNADMSAGSHLYYYASGWQQFSDSYAAFEKAHGDKTYTNFQDDPAKTYDATGNVGGEWAYKGGINVAGFHYGVSSSGLSDFGAADRFDLNQNLSGPSSDSPSGLQLGLLPFINGLVNGGQVGNLGNNGVQFMPLGANSVTFDLGAITSSFHTANITGVRFQYGTSNSEANFTGTVIDHQEGGAAPLPASAGAAMALFAMLGVLHVRRNMLRGFQF
jgi:hypothetical protein